jgi:hypothetical protein
MRVNDIFNKFTLKMIILEPKFKFPPYVRIIKQNDQRQWADLEEIIFDKPVCQIILINWPFMASGSIPSFTVEHQSKIPSQPCRNPSSFATTGMPQHFVFERRIKTVI